MRFWRNQPVQKVLNTPTELSGRPFPNMFHVNHVFLKSYGFLSELYAFYVIFVISMCVFMCFLFVLCDLYAFYAIFYAFYDHQA